MWCIRHHSFWHECGKNTQKLWNVLQNNRKYNDFSVSWFRMLFFSLALFSISIHCATDLFVASAPFVFHLPQWMFLARVLYATNTNIQFSLWFFCFFHFILEFIYFKSQVFFFKFLFFNSCVIFCCSDTNIVWIPIQGSQFQLHLHLHFHFHLLFPMSVFIFVHVYFIYLTHPDFVFHMTLLHLH